MSTKTVFFLIIFSTLLLFACSKQNTKKIPIISKDFLKKENFDSLKKMSFYNQFNKELDFNSVNKKVSVVNFFFTSCTTICPVMENNLQDVFKQNEAVQFISYTIDPERDSVSVLKEYHKRVAKNATNRTFINGSKKDLKKIAKLYLSSIKNDDDAYFYHTSSVVLLDKKMRIRGFYDALNKEEIILLNEDIQLLLKE